MKFIEELKLVPSILSTLTLVLTFDFTEIYSWLTFSGIGPIKYFAKFTGKSFSGVQLYQTGLHHRYIPMNSVEFSRRSFLQNTSKLTLPFLVYTANGRKLRIWSHLLEKSLMENFIFCAVISHLKFYETFQTLLTHFQEFSCATQVKEFSLRKYYW